MNVFDKLTFDRLALPLKDNNCQIILKSMHKCRRYGPDKSGRMHARTHTHLSKIVTAMSRFTASGFDRNGIHMENW